MKDSEYKMLQFYKKRDAFVYEAHMITDLVNGLQKLYNSIFENYIRKCDAEKFDEDFNLYCDQLNVLWKDISYYEKYKTLLPNDNFVVSRITLNTSSLPL